MALAEMKRITLFAHQDERDSLLSRLQGLGAVQLITAAPEDSRDQEGLLEPDGDEGALNQLESRLGQLKYALDFFQRHFPWRKNFIQQFTGAKLDLDWKSYKDLLTREARTWEVVEHCRHADEELVSLRNRETRLQGAREDLEPYREADLPLARVGESRRFAVHLGALDPDQLEPLRQALEEEAPEAVVEELGAGRDSVYLCLIHALPYRNLPEILRAHGFAPATVPAEATGTPKEEIERMERELEEIQEQRERVRGDLEELLPERQRLMAVYDHLGEERDRLLARQELARSQRAFVLGGWIKAADLERLQQAVDDASSTGLLVSRDPEPGENPPVAFANPNLVQPFEVVTRLFSVPRPREPDPTPVMAPFFFVSFGVALGDAAYGLLLTLLALYLLRSLKLAGMGERLIRMLLVVGVAAAGFGVLTGGILGDLFHLPALWFDPLQDPMRLLLYTLGLGVVQVFVGMGMKARENIRQGQPLAALYDQGFWYLLIIGLLLLALPQAAGAGQIMALAAVAGIVLTNGRHQANPVMKILSGAGSLYNITGVLSDVLSYSRLLALGMATGVIAVAVNTMGRLAGEAGVVGLVAMVLILVVGHAFNLIISTLSAYVHTSRLQYVEFFGKFFEGGGQAFTPFSIKTQYVDVEEREA